VFSNNSAAKKVIEIHLLNFSKDRAAFGKPNNKVYVINGLGIKAFYHYNYGVTVTKLTFGI
jgi:hypothetical protein